MEAQLPGVQQAADDPLCQLREEDHAHIGAVVIDVVDHSVHPGLFQGEAEAALLRRLEHPQKGVLRKGIALGGDGEAGRGGLAAVLTIEAFDPLLLFQQREGIAEKFLPLRGEVHPPVAAAEELDAQLLLQLPDCRGDAGLRKAQPVGRFVDGPALGDLHHIGQLLKGHGRSFFPVITLASV